MGAFLYGPVHGFMLWNVFPAMVPLALAVALFAFELSVWFVVIGVGVYATIAVAQKARARVTSYIR